MKKIFLSLLILVALMIDLSAQVAQNVNAIKFKELMTAGDAIILDVRTPQEYSRGNIQGSTLINIADPEFVSRINMLQKDKTILIYCLTGSRSSVAANYMTRLGFKKIYNLQQGIIDWNRQGYPMIQSSQAVASTSATYTEQTFSKLLQANKLVLVDFHAVWCAPCKAMKPIIDKVSDDFKGKAKVEKVDVENNKVITAAYQVQTVPGFVLFKEGKKVWSHTGIISYDDLAVVIKKYL
ncbi:MAG: thioredoxin domain-containing protein [Bacteroidota bacterium]|nr:thioredoxin domain-containing protein [Bacteroidota bacterium]